MPQGDQAFIVCNDARLALSISAVTQRLVVTAPALSKQLGETIGQVWRRLGRDAVTVILDADPEVYRLGYGDREALEHLTEVALKLDTTVRQQPGLRICVIIADAEIFIYSPTPQLIEAGPNTNSPGANGLCLTGIPPTITKELGVSDSPSDEVTIGRQPLDGNKVQEIKADLERNPPRRFDVARTERVFNAAFEFVEFKLLGALIERKRVQIPSDLIGLARDEQTKRALETTYRLIDPGDALSGKRLTRAKKWLVDTYLTVLPGYGTVVLRTVKSDFEDRVEQLRRCADRFQRLVVKRLQVAIDRNRDKLVDALLPSVIKAPPGTWRKYGALSEAQVRELLKTELTAILGTSARMVSEVRVKVLFKAVTYESLVNEKFQDLVRKQLPLLAATHEEHTAAPESKDEAKRNALFD